MTRPSGERRRLFFALWPDAPFRARLGEIAAPMLSGLPGRALAPLDWHVTLCFLGAVDEAALEPLRVQAERISASAFALQFDRIEYWSGTRVLGATAAAVPAAALELAGALHALARSVGLAPDERPLRPHVTLIRGISPQAWRSFCDGPGRGLDDGLGHGDHPHGGRQQGGPQQGGRERRGPALNLALAASEFHLAESQGHGNGPGAAAGAVNISGRGEVRRYVTLARWPLQS